MENDLFMSMMPTWQYQDTLMEINSSSSSDQSPANCLFIPFSDIWPENPLKFNSVTSSPVSPPPSVKTPTNDDSMIKEFDNSPKLGNIFMGLNSITPNFSGERSSGFGSKSFNGRTLNPYESPMAAQWSCLEGSSASNPESEKVNLKKRKTVRGKVKEVEDESNSRIAKQSENGSLKREENAEEKKQNDVKKPEPLQDYIHVRARRGQATDSHSLAERIRREKISDRMKILQDIVPGCNKVTGKAVMLDEIINYVQSLQSQVEFLSMKLASVDSSSMGFNTEGIGSSIMKDVLEDTVHPPEKYCQENLPLNSSNRAVSHRLVDPQQLLLSYENFIGDDLQTLFDLEFGQTALNPLSFHG